MRYVDQRVRIVCSEVFENDFVEAVLLAKAIVFGGLDDASKREMQLVLNVLPPHAYAQVLSMEAGHLDLFDHSSFRNSDPKGHSSLDRTAYGKAPTL